MSQTAKLVTKVRGRPRTLEPGRESHCPEAARPTADMIDAVDNQPVDRNELETSVWSDLGAFPAEVRHEIAVDLAKAQARDMAADALRAALREPDAPSLRKIQQAVGIDPSQVSKIAAGALDGGPHLWTLCRIALALRKRVVISFE